jgi:S1-C subfamily serine protease
MRLIILCFTLISCSIFAENSFLPAYFSAIVQKTIPAVIAIETEDSKEFGFFIREDGYILTNSHPLNRRLRLVYRLSRLL